MASPFWSCPPLWQGETCFILAGGPSVLDLDLSLLEGRRVIAINCSMATWPDADFGIFADPRFRQEYKGLISGFQGQVISFLPIDFSLIRGGAHIMRRVHSKPNDPKPAIVMDRDSLYIDRTTTQSAINLAVHLGVSRIVLLGVDMSRDGAGRSHHHKPHPWPTKPDAWAIQMDQLRKTEPILASLGIDVVNCSLKSLIGWWPKRAFADVISEMDGRKAA